MKLDSKLTDWTFIILGCTTTVVSFIIWCNSATTSHVTKKDQQWRKLLVEKDLAEYNSKTGEWQFRKIDDIAMTYVITGGSQDTTKK